MNLSRDQVIRAALDLLDDTGLNGLSVRKVAERLGVRAPTLYWHVKNKQDLLDEMATTMLRTYDWNAIQADNWRDWLTAAAENLRRMLLSHRDGAKVFSGSHLTDDDALTLMERPLRVLDEAGFAPEYAVHAWATLYTYVIGFTVEEQAVHRTPGERDPRYDPEIRATRVDPGRHPLTHRAGAVLFSAPDTRFSHGVGIIVAGLEASGRNAPRRAAPAPQSPTPP